MAEQERKPDFHCHICGKETDTAPDPPELTVCEEHCEDHDYASDSYRRGRFCTHCDKEAPEDWYDE